MAGQKADLKKQEEQNKVKTILKDTTRRLTKEGEALLNKADKPSLRRLRNDLAKGEYSRFSYPTVTGKLKSKTGGPDIEAGEPEYSELMGDEIRERLEGFEPLTKGQVSKRMGRGSGKVKSPKEKEIEAMGGYEIFKKGGLKKFQSRVKYGGKEYAYVGGGMVSDISHFKPKKKTRRK